MLALDISLYIQRKKGAQGPVFHDPTLWSLYIKLVDWSMPTGGTFETLLATYSGVDNEAPDAPQWASQICQTWTRPQQFSGALGWLVVFTREVLGNPVGREARGLGPWWRLWQYLGGVMESEENGSARAMEDLAYAALVEEIDALHLWDKPTDVGELERKMRVMHL
ncbi:hypothetical protein C8T65DRAFT_746837 [Cerioporus squamosus]|nr:hypothetical protein C8T65DRAFT_746837 [Cerioporus squamosus]